MAIMKFHIQTQFWNVNDLIPTGTCYPTVLACLMDLELHQVPCFNLLYFNTEMEKVNIIKHFQNKHLNGLTFEEYDKLPDKDLTKLGYYNDALFNTMYWLWDNVREYWLASRGYREVYIKREEINQWIKDHPDTPYTVSGISPRSKDITHVVIHMNGKLLHDPHPSQADVYEDDGKKFSYTFLEKI